jgi:hypothetical protein
MFRVIFRWRIAGLTGLAAILAIGLVVAFGVPTAQSAGFMLRTVGSASTSSYLDAKASCEIEALQLDTQFRHHESLVAAVPTTYRAAWLWIPSDVAEPRSGWGSFSAKLCLYEGWFQYGPPAGRRDLSRQEYETMLAHLPVVPDMAFIMAADGEGGGNELTGWPTGVLRVKSLRLDGPKSLRHWPPW